MIFGDIEPEDGWDPDDDPHVLVDNLERRLVLLHAEREPNEYESLTQRLLGIGGRVEFARQRPGLTARDLLRIDHLDDDVAWTWGRL